MGAGTHTVGLCIITKGEAEDESALVSLIADIGRFVDQIYLQVNGSKADAERTTSWFRPGVAYPHQTAPVNVSYFKWNDDFAEARNALLKEVKTDYWCWLDTDDELVGAQNLHALAEDMATRGIDAMYAMYEYAHNEQGECIVLQWRERLVKTAHPFYWMGAVHESAISTSRPLLDRTEAIVVRHQKTPESHSASAERNHKILLREHKKAQKDPRITHYLALSYFNKGDYKKAIHLFHKHIATSGWDEDQYRSWFYIGQSYGLMGDNRHVLEAALEGIRLIPNRPECYVLAATAEFEMGDMGKCLEWLKNSSTKPAPKESLSAIDPTYYSYKAEFLAAQAYLRLGKIKEAYEQLKLVLQHSPNFPAAREVAPLFQEIYDDEAAVSKIQWLCSYAEAYGGKPARVFDALPARLLADPRLNDTRAKVFPPVTWPENAIAFFCGHAAEPWGPDTIQNGIGGSEEAVIYLSRELTKLGWEVTVYGDREEEYRDGAVRYLPWTMFNPKDEFNVLVAWRNPGFFATLPVNARKKLVDLHDMPVGHQDIEETFVKTVDKFMFKSQFQCSLLKLPPEKAAVVSNGVVLSQFDGKVKRRKHSVGYYSSYDRGLECLLDLWPRIRAEVPDATLDIYYGWNYYDVFHQNNPAKMQWKWKMIRKLAKLKKDGVTEHGRVSHEDLAQAMKSTEVWAYPTEFPEINCITALKCGLAGCIPVTSGYAALQETVLEPEEDYGETIYSDPAKQDEFVKRVAKALKEGRSEGTRADYGHLYRQFSWSSIAAGWDKALRENR